MKVEVKFEVSASGNVKMGGYEDFHWELTRNSYNGFQATMKTKIKMEAKQKKKSKITDRCST